MLFLILFQNSALDNNLGAIDQRTGASNTLTMFRGETQHIPVPRWTQEVRVTVASNPAPSRGIQAAVFWFSGHDCPGLDGPTVELQHDDQHDLAPGGYDYDYYNFNPGSSIDIRFNQLYGGTYFYLLKGYDALEGVREGTDDYRYWDDVAVAKHYAKPNSKSSLHYRTSSYDRDDGDNIYTLVYDNESDHDDSELDVETDIVRTSHDLYGAKPECDSMRRGDYCSIPASRSDCIIVEAFLSGGKDDSEELAEDEEETSLDGSSDDDKSISLRIETYRNWNSILQVSLIPFVVSIVLFVVVFFWNSVCARSTTHDENIDLEEPLLSPETDDGEEDGDGVDLPPPMAPNHVPEATAEATASMPEGSAPPAEEDVITVPAENVEVVTK